MPATLVTWGEALIEAEECMTMGRIWGIVKCAGTLFPIAAVRRMMPDVAGEDFDDALRVLVAGGVLAAYAGDLDEAVRLPAREAADATYLSVV